MKLVNNWQAAPKWMSMQFIALAASWEAIPDDVKLSMVSQGAIGKITFALLILAALGRVIDQGTATPVPGSGE